MDIDFIKTLLFCLIILINKDAIPVLIAAIVSQYIYEVALLKGFSVESSLNEHMAHLSMCITYLACSSFNINKKIKWGLWSLAVFSTILAVDLYITEGAKTYIYLSTWYVVNLIDGYIIFQLIKKDAIRILNNIYWNYIYNRKIRDRAAFAINCIYRSFRIF